jgi:hypothetical protein
MTNNEDLADEKSSASEVDDLKKRVAELEGKLEK